MFSSGFRVWAVRLSSLCLISGSPSISAGPRWVTWNLPKGLLHGAGFGFATLSPSTAWFGTRGERGDTGKTSLGQPIRACSWIWNTLWCGQVVKRELFSARLKGTVYSVIAQIMVKVACRSWQRFLSEFIRALALGFLVTWKIRINTLRTINSQ